jgi:hypothetical protein
MAGLGKAGARARRREAATRRQAAQIGWTAGDRVDVAFPRLVARRFRPAAPPYGMHRRIKYTQRVRFRLCGRQTWYDLVPERTQRTGPQDSDRGIGLNGNFFGSSFQGSKIWAPLVLTSLTFRVTR